MTTTVARVALVVAMAAMVAVTACGSSATAPDAGPADADASDAPADAGDNCNGLAPLGPLVTATCDTGAPPPATGGTIVDGTYLLSESHFFGTCAASMLGETLVISGGKIESLAIDAGGAVLRKSLSYTASGSGTTMVETQTCPLSVVATIRFSATPTTLTIYLVNSLGTRLSTFTRM
jgi:major membrane immunogen (membrane-anchored lipoprotein)